MELRHLRYFVAVGEEEHFGRAAKRLALTQPALSRQVHQLERELGASLFQPSGRGVRLTSVGRILVEDARDVLAGVERAARRARLAGQGKIGTLSVSFVDTTFYSDIPPRVIAEFRRLHPDVQIELATLNSVEQWNALGNGAVNVGFVYFQPSDFPQLRSETVARDHVVLAIPKGYSLLRKPRLRLLDLRDEPFVWIRRAVSPTYYDRIAEACLARGLTLNVVQEATTESTMMGLVAGGVGLSFAVASTRRRKPGAVVLRKVEDLNIRLRLDAIWRADDESPALSEFLEVLRQSRKWAKSGRALLA